MKKYIIVDVTQEDIDYGRAGNARSCPIAHAVRRQLKPGLISRLSGKEERYVSVGGTWADVDDDSYKLPNLASRFINEFDNGREVHPFWFLMVKN